MKPKALTKAEFIARRDAVFRNPTMENVKQLWRDIGQDVTPNPTNIMAGVHKARLQWKHATDEMRQESIKWLEDHGFKTSFFGIPPKERNDE